MSTRRRVIYSTLGIVLLGSGLVAFSGLGRSKTGVDPSRLVTVERGTMVRSVVATGKIEPIAKIEVKSKANGIIEALHVTVGDTVEPGQVLVELDRVNLAARVREARANLQAAEAALAGAEAAHEKTKIEAEGPEVDFARRAWGRARDLHAQQLVSQSQLEEAQSALEVAENRQRAAQGNLRVAGARVAEAGANVSQARAALERAEEELANATIRAPIRGAVLTRDVERGSPVSSILNLGASATLVMTLGDIDRVFVRGKVDESDVGHVRVGQRARIRVETFRDRSFEGRVTLIAPMGVERDNVTTFEVEVSIDNPGNELKANMTAHAEIVLEEHPGSLIVPEAALGYDAERHPYVDVLAPGEPGGRRRVPVKVGVSDGSRTQVLDGLRENDQVILPG